MKDDGARPSGQSEANGRLWHKTFYFFTIIAAWYGLSRLVPLEAWLVSVLTWVESMGSWGPAIFIVLYVPSCVLMFPDIFPNAAAGALWGIGVGGVAVSFGRMIGSAATFLIVRRIGGRWVERKMAADPKFAAVAEAVGREGFRIVALLRLCPLFPVIMLNYGLGLTRVTLPAYMAATLVGMVPRTVFVAYVGSGARSLADLAGGGETPVAGDAALFWTGLAISLLIVVILARKARKLINEATQQSP